MQIDQRGAKSETSGTIDNLLIDDIISRDVALHRRNMFTFWIDVKKAFDSVSHSWLLEMLKLHRVPTKLIDIIRNIISKWNLVLLIPIKVGLQESNSIQLTNGELQGDTLYPSLYTLCSNPVSWMLRSTEGCTLSSPIKEKITHTFFIDDLKGYTKSIEKGIKVLNKLKQCMEDSGLLWNEKKCKVSFSHRGKLVDNGHLHLRDGMRISYLKKDETYKFMGVYQTNKNAVDQLQVSLLDKVKKRSHIIWTSQLSDYNKIIATNIFVNSSAEYYFWACKFQITFLREMDASIRKSMNISGAKHTNLINAALYLPRAKGGRGLRCIEQTYKEAKIKIAMKITNTKDQRVQLVKTFHNENRESNSYSIYKEAVKYANEFDINLEVTDNTVKIDFPDGSQIDSENENSDTILGKKLIIARNEKYLGEILRSPWQGVTLKSRNDDQNITSGYFDWLSKWNACPTGVISELFSLFYQTLPTKCFQITMSIILL